MNKAELVCEMSSVTGLTKKKTNEIIDVITDSVTRELVDDNKVNITGFGYFEAVKRAPKIGRNPKTGIEIPIPAVMKPKFKASRKLTNVINT